MSRFRFPSTCSDTRQTYGCVCKPRDHTKWAVTQRYRNHSAFNGYHRTTSAYSEVRCSVCLSRWRTKAAYVARLPDLGAKT